MQSFRTELENKPNKSGQTVVERDIVELERKIRLFREGRIDEDKFRSLRLARGVYGQRQQGVQMVRIKLPYGKLTVKQLLKIADISDEYAIRNLHLTTRQDIQIHFVSLEKTPELWAKLEQDDITLREACGNTVRNVTASDIAGIDPNEPFDVTPYAHATFNYFLRNPICQELGRKFKIAFSSSDADTARVYMHDIGFIPKIKVESGKEVRGFKVVVGGGLGAQPFLAKTAHEFLHEDLIIPYIESVLRVFDRHGERTSRHKARIKYLIAKIGFEELTRLVNEELKALKSKEFKINHNDYPQTIIPNGQPQTSNLKPQTPAYEAWLKTSTFEQKQKGFYGVYIRVLTGDLKTDKARQLAEVVKKYAADDIRITINQGLLFKFVRKDNLPHLFQALEEIGFAEPGFDSIGDITTCPGTDTCNLGISNSTGITRMLEKMIREEYPDLIYNNDIKIKISGCMNSCGQHGIANIGFHGCSMKAGNSVLPAMQVLIGGGTVGNGVGRVADKVIKVPSKRVPCVLRALLHDYEDNSNDGEYFNDYYDRKGEKYFYQLLKPLADLSTVTNADFVDWEHETSYEPAIGVGECAGVMVDLVSTLLLEAEEKLESAKESLADNQYADSIYHSYSLFVNAAKALLLDKQVSCNTQIGIINDFTKHFISEGLFKPIADFKELVLQINQNEPSKEFAHRYFKEAEAFLAEATRYKEERSKVEGNKPN